MHECDYSTDYRPAELDAVPILATNHPALEIYELAAELAPTRTWAEFGLGRGMSARRLLRFSPEKFFAFDSFEGIPEPWQLSRFHIEEIGMWKAPRASVRDLWRRDNVEIVEGLYADTLPFTFPEQLGLVNIDCDIYSSTRDVLFGCDPWLGDGTVLVFDELYGYAYYNDHEYRALCEWREATGKQIQWHGRAKFQAIGVIRNVNSGKNQTQRSRDFDCA